MPTLDPHKPADKLLNSFFLFKTFNFVIKQTKIVIFQPHISTIGWHDNSHGNAEPNVFVILINHFVTLGARRIKMVRQTW